ncbi:NAD-dependent protein deacetylase sirtuin-2-like [Myxocyprinus asiaticus]|uniref:NAD-dependent protein deacetylase sirtuin-2-like n=1 Tax=Myxocyprinus asiaticus TaxID=70543 RepID=UPI0022236CC9|nr:NAD-dependent protein deacetylase sirtuin-2-like [Myxocyprinus asiaticus]
MSEGNKFFERIEEETDTPVLQGQSDDSSDEDEASGNTEMDFPRSLFSRTLGLSPGEKVLDELTLDGVARYILSGKCKNIICMVGVGISTTAGIPDFRSPGTGLYANLQKYNLPYPEAIFQNDYFKKHPEPFFALARELYPGQFKPTVCHYFMRMLKDKGLLRRCYSQNIDTLERVAGLEGEDLIEAHGTFHTSHCVSFLCQKEYSMDWMKDKIFSEDIPKYDSCGNLVKPALRLITAERHNRLINYTTQGANLLPEFPHWRGQNGGGDCGFYSERILCTGYREIGRITSLRKCKQVAAFPTRMTKFRCH